MQNLVRERGKRKACQHHQDAISPTWLLPYKPQKGKNATKQNRGTKGQQTHTKRETKHVKQNKDARTEI